jgi:hypothetical protein
MVVKWLRAYLWESETSLDGVNNSWSEIGRAVNRWPTDKPQCPRPVRRRNRRRGRAAPPAPCVSGHARHHADHPGPLPAGSGASRADRGGVAADRSRDGTAIMTTSIKDAIKRKPGRPPLEIDWALAEKLAQIGCTDEEIASIVGVSHETFVRVIAHPSDRGSRVGV